jgi:hypothetical protein
VQVLIVFIALLVPDLASADAQGKALAYPVAAGSQVSVQLRDGRRLSGALVTNWEHASQTEIQLRVGEAGMTGVVRFAAADVLQAYAGLSHEATQRRDIRAMIGRAQNVEQARSAFGLAQELSDITLIRAAAKKLRSFDRHDTEAAQALGLVKRNGIWMTPAEQRQADGMVRYRKRWVMWEEQWQAQQAAAKKLAASRERAAERRAARQQAVWANQLEYSSTYYAGPLWPRRYLFRYGRVHVPSAYGRGRIVYRRPNWSVGFRW